MYHLLIVAAALAAPSASATDIASLDADVAAVVQHEHLPGLAMAVVEQGRVVYQHAEGARGDGTASTRTRCSRSPPTARR